MDILNIISRGFAFLAAVCIAVPLHADVKTDVAVAGESTDSLTVMKDIDEIVVEAQSIHREGNTLKLFPTKRDKRFASGGMDVLANMHLSEVVINPLSGDATYADGEPISFFIDFQPASQQRLQEIRPQDIERIDIIRAPEDPRFQNAKVAANYIMKKYVYGGYTKFDGKQFAPFYYGDYGLYSKFSYKRMTYDLSTGLHYTRSGNESGTETDASYRFTDKTVTRHSATDSYKSRLLNPRVSGRAIYNARNISIANTFGFNFSRRKPQNSTETVTFSDLYQSTTASTETDNRNRNATWTGNYWFGLADDLSLSFNGGVDWASNRENSDYTLLGHYPILNHIDETALNTYGQLSLTKEFGKHSLNVSGAGGWTRNKLDYVDIATTGVNYREGYGQIGVGANLSFNILSINPGIRLSLTSERLNDSDHTRLLPKAFMPFYLQLTKRSSLSGSFEFAIGSAEVSMRSPVLVRSNELEAVRGNLHLKNYDFYNARLGYSHWFGQWLSARIDADFKCDVNPLVPVYTEDVLNGMPLMIRDVANGATSYKTVISATLSGSYFDNLLAVSVQGSLRHFSQKGCYSSGKWESGCWINASYYLGNFRLNAYFTPESVQHNAWYDCHIPLFWYVGASWAWEDLYVDLRLSNPFVKSYVYETRDVRSQAFNQKLVTYDRSYHQSIRLMVSYSFGYGRKMNRQDEVGATSGAQSIILK